MRRLSINSNINRLSKKPPVRSPIRTPVARPVASNSKQLCAIGAPFDIRSSSCHAKTPTLFKWTNVPGPYPTVVMDGAITSSKMLNGVPNKYAWICESMALDCAVDVNKILNDKRVHASYKKIFISDRSKLGSAANIEFCYAGSNLPWISHHESPPQKTKMCSMMSSAKDSTYGHKYRLKIAEKLKNKLDLFGGACGSPRIGQENKTIYGHMDKSVGIVPYMFSVVMENASYEGYFTEKISDCFASWTIPIYWGCKNIGDYFDKNGVIELTEDFDPKSLTEELYKSKMNSMIENNKRIKEFIMADDYLYQRITSNG